MGLNLQAQTPNILMIVSDDLNTRIGPYMDIDNHTPHLDRLANEGVRFSRAYSQFPLCGPSRASFMSGLYPQTNGVLGNNDQPGSYKKETPALANHPSIAGFFRERGYYTARVSKIFHMGVPGGIERGEPGGDEPDSWDYAYNVLGPETLSQGNLELLSPKNHHYGSNFAQMVIADSLERTQTDYLAASQAIAILENRAGKIPEKATNKQKIKKEAPFFLAVGFVRPHVPLIAPESSFSPYPVKETVLPSFTIGENVPEPALRRQNDKIWGMDELQQRKTISAYMASVRFMDQQVGRLLDALDRMDLRKETIVIFMSDHGYNLGEHDCWSKSSLWEGSVAAPLIISVPGSAYEGKYGTTSYSITELIDLYPTLADLAGFANEKPSILQGESLAGFLKEGEYEKSKDYAYTITQGGTAASIRTNQWRYTRWGEDASKNNEELYDHHNDPEEHFNLVGNPLNNDVLIEIRNQFEKARINANSELGSSNSNY
ncbi:sulfatase [Cyclobacterium jeungdonense]|uniref:Sulfatase n=1 Tax=Cyclobacterium jeungdonense TaxID=708087 RepID=A0ABT8CCG2_9BACT|nr:sulfatase [Cyclobacterium jeungdonense]MDN3690504.1 sulfatase [Cyclobacterium jeungdonense]